MADVAALAGVSGQTVSRVLNESPRVDPVTRARVEAAMTELGYRPHRAARALRTGRTQTIGLLVSTLATVGNSRMLQAVAGAAASRGYALTVVTLGDEGGGAGVGAAFERLSEQGVDGVVVLNEATAAVRDAPVPGGLRLIVVDSPPEMSARGGFGVVQSDHAAGAREATEHLLALGHAVVHHLAGPAESFASAERERGWREALATAGIAAPEPVRGDWTAASARVVVAPFVADPDVTAVFAANDQSALGAIRAFADAGRAVPDDVSMVGFDDIADAADYRPPLTTVRQDFDRLGELAVAALVAAIEGGPAEFQVVPTALVLRESTARSRRDHAAIA
ncbi:LacI family DNA-binding transcriptional regulator [Microbacterium sp. 2FI]|uniref:LacI family DNA-binding transcriptional regulator n=1 Tax=Microbacterium sp. 2FI TaxID=2502193 RepID=UPI0010F4581E|nr:LacI family DNA-binding transcriptional regulator [Microbacterium sp. 2FI]